MKTRNENRTSAIQRRALTARLILASLLHAGLTAFAGQAQAQGGVPLWTNRYNAVENNHDYARAIAVDRRGNAFVTGSSADRGSYSYTTIKYSGAGVPLWTNLYNGTSNTADYATSIAVDRSGNVFVTGRSYT